MKKLLKKVLILTFQAIIINLILIVLKIKILFKDWIFNKFLRTKIVPKKIFFIFLMLLKLFKIMKLAHKTLEIIFFKQFNNCIL